MAGVRPREVGSGPKATGRGQRFQKPGAECRYRGRGPGTWPEGRRRGPQALVLQLLLLLSLLLLVLLLMLLLLLLLFLLLLVLLQMLLLPLLLLLSDPIGRIQPEAEKYAVVFLKCFLRTTHRPPEKPPQRQTFFRDWGKLCSGICVPYTDRIQARVENMLFSL